MRTWRGGGVHRKRLTSVLCVLSVATAVSGSAEQVTSRGVIWTGREDSAEGKGL